VARISGVDLPPGKRVEIGLTYVFGIGRYRALRILDAAKVQVGTKVKDLTDGESLAIQQVINQEGRVEGDLRQAISMDIKRLIEIGSYRGMRHRRNLPVRGQRTHTNARTRRGPKRAIAGKRKAVGKK
jgi:small subunit ribosomal protein S13